MVKWRYAVILDAGSSGTRVYVYRWLDSARARQSASPKELKSLPEIKTKKHWTKKIQPGISTFADKPSRVGPDHLDKLLKHALDVIPEPDVKDTPFFLLATAGMRLLSDADRDRILSEVCSYVKSHSNFLVPDCGIHIQVIPGATEGLYGWIAANYLLDSFDGDTDAHESGHHTYGFLDMGGASAQIAFVPSEAEARKHANDLTLLRLRNLDGSIQEYKVFVTSWLEFGVREARRRYVEALQKSAGGPKTKEIPDPCLPDGLRTSLDGKPVSSESRETQLFGTGRFDECLELTYPLLDKDAPCPDEPCLLHGIHVPAIDFNVNHFVGISEYWHTTYEIFEMGYKDKAYDFNTYQERVNQFCSQDWSAIEKGISEHRWGSKVDEDKAMEVCFKASWIINMLHSGIGIPRVGLDSVKASTQNGTKEVLEHGKEKGYLSTFQAVNEIDSTEVSWTLGKAVLYASSLIPVGENDLPVGFGSNQPGVPPDFQYPSIRGPTIIKETDFETWREALFGGESPRRIPGLLLFLLIVVIMAFYLCGRNRRGRIYHKLQSFFGHKGSRFSRGLGGKLLGLRLNSPAYERVMEEGGLDLGEMSGSSESDRGDSLDYDSSKSPSKRSSLFNGSNTPTLKFELDNGSGSSIGLGISNIHDRQGMVLRNDSREHLVPAVASGSRSRAGSPTRMYRKSPVLAPMDGEQ
ncbi:hypothetical protein VTN49DRAFT_4343 [Thermomyces lanuginosus]|uniref:uncharacterized protein n=1 Tax=Thermomyces lanuginosus TaxID=5541 RepID=UPI003744935B